MADIRVNDDTIDFGEVEKTVRHPVKKSLQADDVFIVLLDVPQDTVDNQNVIGFDEDGQRLWEIDAISGTDKVNQPYVNLFEKDGDAWVYNPIGAECRLDPATGNFTEKLQKK